MAMALSLQCPQWPALPHAPLRAMVRNGDRQTRIVSVWRVLVLLCGGVFAVGLAAAAWVATPRTTQVQTRIVADDGGKAGNARAGRVALAEAALRIGSAPGHSAMLDEHGTALIISVEDSDSATARHIARSLTEALLALPLTLEPAQAKPQPADPGAAALATLMVERNRLTGLAETEDARAGSASASLTTVMRDLAAGARSPPAEKRAGREILDKGSAALADLELQRIQLQSRYQDDYPAVVVLVNQIATLKLFLQDQARRVEPGGRPVVDPAESILTGERDRLRSELYQAHERRLEIATTLAANTRALDSLKADIAAKPAETTPSSPPATMLVEAATTVAHGPDIRLVTVPGAFAGAVGLSLLAWLRPARRNHLRAAAPLVQRFATAVNLLPVAYAPALSPDGSALVVTAGSPKLPGNLSPHVEACWQRTTGPGTATLIQPPRKAARTASLAAITLAGPWAVTRPSLSTIARPHT